jgi:hypothetical protein
MSLPQSMQRKFRRRLMTVPRLGRRHHNGSGQNFGRGGKRISGANRFLTVNDHGKGRGLLLAPRKVSLERVKEGGPCASSTRSGNRVKLLGSWPTGSADIPTGLTGKHAIMASDQFLPQMKYSALV